MSREFGDHCGGFFHDKIRGAAEDARGGHDPLTLAWGKVIGAMEDVAYSISSVEAGDSGPSDLQIESVKARKMVRDALYEVDALVSSVVDIQRDAVRSIISALAKVHTVDSENVTIRLPAGFQDKVGNQPQRWRMIEEAIGDVVLRAKGYGWSRSGSSHGGGSAFDSYHYVKSREMWRLKDQVRAALSTGDVAAALRLLDEP